MEKCSKPTRVRVRVHVMKEIIKWIVERKNILYVESQASPVSVRFFQKDPQGCEHHFNGKHVVRM